MASWMPRRWARFNLRALMLLTTLVAAWLGWSAHLVRQRQALLEEGRWSILEGPFAGKPGPSVPWVRRAMGDEPVILLALSDIKAPEGMLQRAKRLFPEATVLHLPIYSSP